MPSKGIYIYGIVPNFYSAEIFRSLENSGIYAIPTQNISAIVSDRNSTYLDYSDRESLGHLLVHHQKTIEDLTAKGFTMLLPMRLGTIVKSKNEVMQILDRGNNLIMESLKKIQSLSEIDLAVTWADFSNNLKEIANLPEIVELKNDILLNPDKIAQVDQVKLGMLVQRKLDEKNKQVELEILNALSSLSVDIKVHEAMNDQMVTNSAFLIHRISKDKFETAIDKLDEQFNGFLNFKIVGPLPCYSFYTLEVAELNPEHIAEAQTALGLNKETTEAEIKKAFLDKAKIFHPDNGQGTSDSDNFKLVQKAYKLLRDYSLAFKQSSGEESISFAREKVMENMILVKIKE
jgi:hypothetical protein